jgi:hypothetical protein
MALNEYLPGSRVHPEQKSNRSMRQSYPLAETLTVCLSVQSMGDLEQHKISVVEFGADQS